MTQHAKNKCKYYPGILRNFEGMKYFFFLLICQVAHKQPDKKYSDSQKKSKPEDVSQIIFQGRFFKLSGCPNRGILLLV